MAVTFLIDTYFFHRTKRSVDTFIFKGGGHYEKRI